VIGLNTAIYAPTGVFSGAGFAVPSNRVREFLARHLPNAAGASKAPGSLWGISVGDLSPAQQMEFPNGGVVVLGVEPNSPAALLQVAPGDVVLSVAAQPVRNITTMRQLQAQLNPSASVPMQVWRRGQIYNLTFNTLTNAAG
jgi:S1-C subfamily serine protease